MRTIFVAYGAYVGRIRSQTKCDVWTDDPVEHHFSLDALVGVDLARNIDAALTGRIAWSEIETDDHINRGGMNTLGPLWPEGDSIGALYLAEDFLARLPSAPRTPAIDGELYELKSVFYHPGTSDPRAGRRYNGFHARVIERRGTRASVEVYPAGSSRSRAPMLRRWIDLASPDICDAGPASMTEIVDEHEGALFIEWGAVTAWMAEAAARDERGARPAGRAGWREGTMAAAAALSLAIGVAQGLTHAGPPSSEVADVASQVSEQWSAAEASESPLYCTPLQVRLKIPLACGEG